MVENSTKIYRYCNLLRHKRGWRIFWIFIFISCGLFCNCALKINAPAGITLYIATDGSDANTGTSEKPFATLERARDEIRRIKKSDRFPTNGIVVEIAPGTYFREQSFELEHQDSGTPDAPIVYRAEHNASVRLIGGKAINNWAQVSNSLVIERLDESARTNVLQADLRTLGIVNFGSVNSNRFELFFRGNPMIVARWPNEGFIKISGLVEPDTVNVRGAKGSRRGEFTYDGDRPARWLNESDAWVHGYWFWDWADQRQRIASIDPKNRRLLIAPPYHSYGYRVGQWFYAFNILSELDRPGEWYLDRVSGVLYFWPPQSVEKNDVMVSIIPIMIRMMDVENIVIRGFTIEAVRETAIQVTGGRNIQITNSTIRNIGETGIQIDGGVGHLVANLQLYQIGAAGISVNGGDRRTLQPAGHVVQNNHIHHYGRWKPMNSPGISAHGVGIRIANNLIHDGPHNAIYYSGNNHLIEFNEIHDVCLESNDAGAIYAGRDWTMRGTVIRHNYLHHINGFQNKGAVGVYLDDMYSGTTVYGNVFYRVSNATFIGGGRDNTVVNNVFVECEPAVHVDARAMGWASDTASQWINEGKTKATFSGVKFKEAPYSEFYPKLVSLLDENPPAPLGNRVIHNIRVGGKWKEVDGKSLPYTEFTNNLLDKDPFFVKNVQSSDSALRIGDFQLREDSPAWLIGFQRIPLDKIGLREKERDVLRK